MPIWPDDGYGKTSVWESPTLNDGKKLEALEKPISVGPMEEVSENEFPCLPVPGEFLTLQQVFEILKNTDKTFACIPSGEKSNVYFVIQKVSEAKRRKVNVGNPFSDDCGRWDHTLSTTSNSYVVLDNERVPRVVYLKKNDYCYEDCSNGIVHWIPLKPQPEKSTVIKLVRHCATLKGCDSFRRQITCVVGGDFHSKAVVEYCGRQPPAIMVHEKVRNKRNRNACQNPQTITNNMSEIHEHSNMANTQESQGNKLLRNSRDVRWEPDLMKYQMNEKNAAKEILEVLAMLNQHPSIQEVNHLKNKAPCVILYTDEQMDDMKRNIKCGSIIGVDRTFGFGDCLLTFTTYKNHRVLHEDSNMHPLFPGPMYLHWDENFETYHYFFAHLQTLLADTLCDFDIRLGSNLDMNLIKAIKSCFPTSVQMLCSEQLKKNSTEFLSKEGQCEEKFCDVLLGMIFGVEGITASPDEVCFKSRVMSVLLYCHKFPVLKEYFSRLNPLLLTYVCEPHQKGYCKGLWTSSCASTDSFLKMSLEKRHMRFPELMNMISHIMTSQMLDLREVLCGGVSHALIPAFEKQVDKNEWMKKTEDEKVEFFKEYLKNELQ
ncbi:hypothetical protein GWK47_045185 [Chionoecetes opilio]|uniref:Uncharacterized protein n=1 Tax=Chionoecetes opilio TaxID=41210 RepID=A0A8J5CVB0_CHIOP|nr:hypothetical protein GWK47_045185 [Chionoecetes opilio]